MIPVFSHLLDVSVETGESATFAPSFLDPIVCRSEQRDEAIVQLYLVAEIPFELVYARLRAIGPDTEHIAKILDCDKPVSQVLRVHPAARPW